MPAEFPVVAIGASAGALDAIRRITEALPRDCAAAIAAVFHVIQTRVGFATPERTPPAPSRCIGRGWR